MIAAPRVEAIAQELLAAYSRREPMAAPSAREAAFDLDAAYAVEAELTRLRRAAGWSTVGRKVGYANKALWRALKLDTLVWASMYDRTVQLAVGGRASVSLARFHAPRLEPEIVVKIAAPIRSPDAGSVLGATEWIAVGFEIVDCVYPDWTFEPADFVAAFGLHAALIVGPPRRVEASAVPGLVDQLARFTVRLLRDEQLVDTGGGRQALRSPALCVGELAAALERRRGAEPLAAGEIVSTGTLTAPQPLVAGEWRAEIEGLDVEGLALRVE
jgi:2-oxo-3-hexenedioate decarboxylase